MKIFKLPDLGEGLQDAEIVEWHVKAGDEIAAERGNTITLSNFGMIGGKYAAPIVIPPTVAILGAGRICQQVVAVSGVPAVHRVLPLSLTFDHRVVTGGEAARFLAAAIGDLTLAT
jgi:2-oxoisovalerate dehydrogenase E2 component (dihydrolipoyl transacylase)